MDVKLHIGVTNGLKGNLPKFAYIRKVQLDKMNSWLTLPCLISSRARSDQKMITATSEPEQPNPHIPVLTEFKSVFV